MQRYSSTGRVSSLPSQSGSSVLRIQHRLERDRNAGILRPQHIHRFAKRILTRVHESDALFRVDDPDSFHSPLEVFLDLRSYAGHAVVRRENLDRKERRRRREPAANLVRSAPNRCIRHSKARFARADAQFDSHLTAIMFGLQTQQFKHPALNPGMKWFTPIALHNLAVDVLAVRSIETAAQLLLC